MKPSPNSPKTAIVRVPLSRRAFPIAGYIYDWKCLLCGRQWTANRKPERCPYCAEAKKWRTA